MVEVMRVLVKCTECGHLRDYHKGTEPQVRSENSLRRIYGRLSSKGFYARVVLDLDGTLPTPCPCEFLLTAPPP